MSAHANAVTLVCVFVMVTLTVVVVGAFMPPPQAQQASFAVLPKLAKSLPFVAQRLFDA
jgi:hypothetical protein